MENSLFIVHLIRPATGGMQNHVLELVGGLRQKGHRLAVIGPPNETLKAELKLMDIGWHEIGISDRLSFSDPLTVMRLARLLKQVKPDVLHIHGNKTALVGGIAAALAGVRSTVVTVHNYLMYQNASRPKQAVAGFIDRRLAARADRIIAVSDNLKKSLVANESFEPSKIAVIHNGVDLDRWRETPAPKAELRARLGLGPQDFVAVSVGRLVDWKGHEVLIEAAARALPTRPDLKVIIAGDGPLFDKLSQSIKDRGLEAHIFLLGRIADIRPLLALSDIFVLPSKKEPFGLVLLEAMAAGLPVVAADAGGVPEIITAGLNGILVPPGDIAALAEAIEDLAADDKRRRDLAVAGRVAVQDRFSLDMVVDRTELIYRECLANQRTV